MSTPFGRNDLVLCAGTVRTTPFLERLEPARRNGYRGVSITSYDLKAAQASGTSVLELAQRVVDAGLAIAEFEAITSWLDLHVDSEASGRPTPMRGNTAERVCPTAAAVGAPIVTLVELMGADIDVDVAAEGFAHVCDVAAEHGLIVALEFLGWAGIPTLSRAVDIVRVAGRANGTVQVDSWHLFRSGSSLDDLAATPGSLVGSVQIDDAPAQAEEDAFQETMHRRLIPGAGEFDLTGFVQTLADIGYEGPLGVEVLSDDLLELPVDDIAVRCATGTRSVLESLR